MSYFSHDTIVQIATPPGQAQFGAVRLSGADALAIAGALQRPPVSVPAVRMCCDAQVGIVLENRSTRGAESEPAMLACPARLFLMPAPNSYTREHVVEIHAVGSPVILKAIMDACVRAGARAALPGEFTFRAFRNGRLSLGQAEAVEELVKSGNDAERKGALRRLGDHDAAKIAAWRDKVMDLAAQMEATLDFAAHEIEVDAAAGLASVAAELERDGVAVARSSRVATAEGPHVALVGMVNAGKSSLLNALVGSESVLVSAVPSTTRDSLRYSVRWHGVSFVLSDNPGFHPEGDGGGRAAADMSFDRLGGEDVACWVMDATEPLGEREALFARHLVGPVVLVLNKSDKQRSIDEAEAQAFAGQHGASVAGVHSVSAKTGVGIPDLIKRLAGMATDTKALTEWNARESAELTGALAHCRAAVAELGNAGRLELAADDVRLAVEAFSRAMGDGYAEEALTRIFSRFCIGK